METRGQVAYACCEHLIFQSKLTLSPVLVHPAFERPRDDFLFGSGMRNILANQTTSMTSFSNLERLYVLPSQTKSRAKNRSRYTPQGMTINKWHFKGRTVEVVLFSAISPLRMQVADVLKHTLKRKDFEKILVSLHHMNDTTPAAQAVAIY
jgi:hypothetical protein